MPRSLLLLFLSCVCCSLSGGSADEKEALRSRILEIHNNIRMSADLLPLEWNNEGESELDKQLGATKFVKSPSAPTGCPAVPKGNYTKWGPQNELEFMVCNPPTNIFTGSYDDVLKTYYYPGNNRSMDSCTEFDAVMKKTEKRKFKFWLFAKMMWLKMKSVACLRRYVRVSRIKKRPTQGSFFTSSASLKKLKVEILVCKYVFEGEASNLGIKQPLFTDYNFFHLCAIERDVLLHSCDPNIQAKCNMYRNGTLDIKQLKEKSGYYGEIKGISFIFCLFAFSWLITVSLHRL